MRKTTSHGDIGVEWSKNGICLKWCPWRGCQHMLCHMASRQPSKQCSRRFTVKPKIHWKLKSLSKWRQQLRWSGIFSIWTRLCLMSVNCDANICNYRPQNDARDPQIFKENGFCESPSKFAPPDIPKLLSANFWANMHCKPIERLNRNKVY